MKREWSTYGINWMLVVLILFAVSGVSEVAAQDQQNGFGQITRRITVVGSKEVEDTIPGSIYFMEAEEMEESLGGIDDAHRVLRRVPGVNVQEEDGLGLRPNIGFRGVSSERSSRITVMEDGVLNAPAPYSAPSAYFFPPIGRMESIEVLKGASIIKYGPYTTGGSLNMLSTGIPENFRFFGRTEFGENDGRKIHTSIGNSVSRGGVLFETYQQTNDGFKVLDNGGDTGFELEDYIGKFRLNSAPEAELFQTLELKANYYSQDSNETYVGLTDDDFTLTPYRRYAGTQLDNIQVDRRAFTLTHFVEFGSGLDLTTVGYYNTTSRNWFKLEKSGGVSSTNIFSDPLLYSQELSWIRGDADSPIDALSLRNNARDYEAYGVQSTLGLDVSTGALHHEIEFSIRYHEDEEDRFQDEDLYQITNGTLLQTTDGAPGSNANRIGSAEALALSATDRITYNDFTFTPGIRYERIDFLREDYGTSDPSRSGANVKKNSNSVDQIIPGIGAHYQVTDTVGAFVGVHRGFSPPGPTSSSEVEAEKSVNYEWGGNYIDGDFRSELVLFYNDYDNLLGADTVSSGGQGTGDLYNGGAAEVFGVEASLKYDFGKTLDFTTYQVPFFLAYTYTDASFQSDFDSEFFGLVNSGDPIPYIAENQLSFGLALSAPEHTIGIEAHYQSEMPTIAGQAGLTSQDETDSFFVVDLKGEIVLSEQVKLFASVYNLFDERYVVARRPAGARPGAPQLFFAGVEVELR